MKRTRYSKIGFVLGTVMLGALTGCVAAPRHARGYGPPPPNYVAAGVLVQDDYVYYPSYQVYYSSHRHQYVYQDGRAWVSRPAPPRVSVDIFFASPSVPLDFHDAPAAHHAAVVRQYPKHWRPSDSSPNHGQGNNDHGNDNDHGNRKHD